MGLEVATFCGGYDSNFLYLAWCKETKEGIIIDTALEPEEIFKQAKVLGIKITKAVVMHSHFDHIVSLDSYRKNGIQLLAHESMEIKVDQKLKDKDTVIFGKESLQVIHTPGHRYDCICLYGGNKIFTSDTLFVHAYGRCDLEGSNPKQTYETLHALARLPGNTAIYPGHDYGPQPTSTIAEEKKYNVFFIYKTQEAFLEAVTGKFRV
ncbi:MBL fold metallo-hydrolase [Candidatus Woesearchaeota archaeon]|nr:MBL fold metallo-hydrolase [Candidatus Woesearchaeota archaeon]